VARRGIRVNTVCPGSVETRMINAIAAMMNPDDPDAATRANVDNTPTGRYSTAEEVAGLILYLCSDLAANITGAEFVIDGGRSSGVGAFLR
jgi:NAD(P)-dependent dehydrogenase (short-subunit alcohol dehydrogenase family)